MIELLTTKQLADRWGVHYKTLYQWRRLGIGPTYMKPGGGKTSTVYYRLKDILSYEKKQLVKTTG